MPVARQPGAGSQERFAIAAVVAGCASDSSVVGTDDGRVQDHTFEAFIVGLGSRTVGAGAGQVDTVPAVYVSTAARSTEPMYEVWFAPGSVRSPSGESAPEMALTAGRRIRLWRHSLLITASDPGVFTADSIIVVN
jgi:hypothetical protein